MKIIFLYFIFIITITSFLHANSSKEIDTIVSKFNLYPGTKATIQWERVFSSERRLKKYGLDQLAIEDRVKLKIYLIKHAADSEQPIVPGL